MRSIIVVAVAALATACGQAQVAPVEEASVLVPAEETRVLAVLSYADWCGSCKALDPKVKAVQAANTFDGVEFVHLDFTDRDETAFFETADSLGVGTAIRGEFSEQVKTGKLYLIDLSTEEIVSVIDKSMEEAEIASTIAAAAAA